MKRKLGLLSAVVLGLGTVKANAAATLLYQWNFDDNGGTGTSVTPNVTPNNLSSDGGTLTMADANGTVSPSVVYTPTNLYSVAGGGYTGLPSDFSFNNSASTNYNPTPGGIAYTTSVNLLAAMPSVSQYTMTMWVKPTTAELSDQSRLFMIGNVNNFDEGTSGTNGIWVGLNAGKIQAGAQAGSVSDNSGATGNALVANVWNFIAIEVDLAASNVYYDAAMQAANGENDSFELYQGNSTSNTYAFTSSQGFANETSTLGSQGDYVQLLNRTSDGQRAFQGFGDDFRVYNGLLTTAQLTALTSVPEPGCMGLLVIAAAGLLFQRRRPGSVVKASGQI